MDRMRFIITASVLIQNAMGIEFNSETNIKFMNDSLRKSDGTIALTKEEQVSVGRLFYNTAVPLRDASFTTAFQIRIQNTSSKSYGAGIAFLMSGTLSPALDNSADSAIGILNADLNGQPANKIVAIEFDTYYNLEYADLDDNHVGIDVNSLNSTAFRSLYDRGIDIRLGTAIMVWVEYDGISTLLSVDVATHPFTKPTTASPFIAHRINLSEYLPNDIYVGFSASTDSNIELQELLSWEFNNTTLISSPSPFAPLPSPADSFPPSVREPIVPSSKGLSSGKIAGIALAAIFLFLLPLLFCLIRRQKKNGEQREWAVGNVELIQSCAGARRFTYKEIMSATENFSKENYLGRGGFGPVYKGILPKVGTPVAVKSVGENSKQGEREFLAEVTIISRIRHRNLVHLQGWCRDKGQLFLVYDFMPNGSLDHHLFKGNISENPRLGWNERHKIVCGLAAGLLYLHEEWEKQVIHRDVKSANVMLDQDFNVRLGDFGMARLVDHDHMPNTTKVVGTFGYIAPEVFRDGKATTASDVYGFGAVALEIACGRPALDKKAPPDQVRLVEWVWEHYSQGALLEVVDPRMGDVFEKEEMEKVLCLGLACSHPHPHSRPTMRQVYDCLHNVTPNPPISTSKPMAVYLNNLFQSPPSSSSQISNEITTSFTGR